MKFLSYLFIFIEPSVIFLSLLTALTEMFDFVCSLSDHSWCNVFLKMYKSRSESWSMHYMLLSYVLGFQVSMCSFRVISYTQYNIFSQGFQCSLSVTIPYRDALSLYLSPSLTLSDWTNHPFVLFQFLFLVQQPVIWLGKTPSYQLQRAQM